ncbi:GTP-binding protein [Escherichia coli]
MENLLLESADKLLRYKGMLWIDGEPNRLCSRASSASTAPTGTGHGAMKDPHSTMVFIGIQLPEDRFGRVCGTQKVTSLQHHNT